MKQFIPKTKPKSMYSNRLRWLRSLYWNKVIAMFSKHSAFVLKRESFEKKHLSNTTTFLLLTWHFRIWQNWFCHFFLFQTNDEWSLIGWKSTHFEITYETKSLLWLLFRYSCTMFWNKFHFEWRLNCIESFSECRWCMNVWECSMLDLMIYPSECFVISVHCFWLHHFFVAFFWHMQLLIEFAQTTRFVFNPEQQQLQSFQSKRNEISNWAEFNQLKMDTFRQNPMNFDWKRFETLWYSTCTLSMAPTGSYWPRSKVIWHTYRRQSCPTERKRYNKCPLKTLLNNICRTS